MSVNHCSNDGEMLKNNENPELCMDWAARHFDTYFLVISIVFLQSNQSAVCVGGKEKTLLTIHILC